MAHDNNGRIYVDTQNNVGIGIEEVRTVLSEAAGADLSSSNRINRWAKKKPLAAGNAGGYTEAQAKAINYGLYVPYYTSFGAMLDAIDRGDWSGAEGYIAGKTPWTNIGLGPGDWARLLDFNGYQHNAPQPVSGAEARETTIGVNDTPVFRCPLAAYNSEYLTLADLGASYGGTEYRGSNMRVGLYFKARDWVMSAYNAAALNSIDRDLLLFPADIFDRTYETALANSCLFLSSAANPTRSSQGVFIPVIPAQSSVLLHFVQPSIAPIYEYQTSWYFSDGADDISIVICCNPNGHYYWDFSVDVRKGTSLADDYSWIGGQADSLRLELYRGHIWNEIEGPTFVKVYTGTESGIRYIYAANYRIMPDSDYVDHPADWRSHWFENVHNGVDDNGDPLVPDSTDRQAITSGTILDGEGRDSGYNLLYAELLGVLTNDEWEVNAGYTVHALTQ